jgi:ribosomal-protein-alanine N-acetyltransferase
MLIETKRLIMRNFITEDTSDAYEYLSNNNVMYYIEDPYDCQQAAEFIKENMNKEIPNVYALVEKISDKVIGHVIFHRYGNDKIYELGWIINENYQNNGYAFEISNELIKYAFSILHIHKIVGETIEGNRASINLMLKLGMKQEAVFKKQNWDHGKWVDEYWFGILENEFSESNSMNN